MPDFLLEIGCEEIPARMIDAASLELRERVQKLLQRERLPPAGDLASFDTPRRLAVLAAGIPAAQPDSPSKSPGPRSTSPSRMAKPRPRRMPSPKKPVWMLRALEKVATSKGEYLSAKVTKKGGAAQKFSPSCFPEKSIRFYWPKNMYWRKRNELFVRPVRWLVAMLDGEVIPLEFDGVRAGNESRGHRILFSWGGADSACGRGLRGRPGTGAKVLDRDAREKKIRQALDAATRTIPGARWREDKSLLDTVVNLTEWPAVILGNFDRGISGASRGSPGHGDARSSEIFRHRRCERQTAPHFLAVLNTDGDPQGIIQPWHRARAARPL